LMSNLSEAVEQTLQELRELSVGMCNWPNLQMARPPTLGFLPTSAGSE